MTRTQAIVDLLVEEAEAVRDDEENEHFYEPLISAARKLRQGQKTFSGAEREAISFALQDIGELYMYAGSSSGYATIDRQEARQTKDTDV